MSDHRPSTFQLGWKYRQKSSLTHSLTFRFWCQSQESCYKKWRCGCKSTGMSQTSLPSFCSLSNDSSSPRPTLQGVMEGHLLCEHHLLVHSSIRHLRREQVFGPICDDDWKMVSKVLWFHVISSGGGVLIIGRGKSCIWACHHWLRWPWRCFILIPFTCSEVWLHHIHNWIIHSHSLNLLTNKHLLFCAGHLSGNWVYKDPHSVR